MARKKPEVPTLVDVEIPEIFAGLAGKSVKRRNEDGPIKSVMFGACPGCSKNKAGLVRQGDHVAWRDHNLQTHAGLSMQCSAVGQRLCDAPARDVWSISGAETPACPCTTR